MAPVEWDDGPVSERGRGYDDLDRTVRELRARLASLVGSHPHAVYSIDLEGRFTMLNAAALEQVGGRSEEELIGREFADLLCPEDVGWVQAQFVSLLGGRASTFELRVHRPDGSEGELVVIGLPIVVDDELVEILAIAEEITERRAAERALAEARSAAESASEAKSAFLATMSHEIRTPLTGVLAAAELLDDTSLDEEQSRLVEVMRRSGDRLLGLVDKILDFSRLGAGTADLLEVAFQLADVVALEPLLLGTDAVERQMEVSCHLDETLPDRLLGDPVRIGQVLSNLVGNAIKFTPSGSVRIEVTPLAQDEETVTVRFAVSDTGVGLDPVLAGQVFELFSQGDSSITREYGGTGIGLAISRQLVELMGGRIDVESAPGRGSTFTVDLPLRRTVESVS